ncbi:histidinol-phosphate aminotransferase family protein [bacterium]|nr:histidinol-phosphate aminotransferase family protein [bacterium]
MLPTPNHHLKQLYRIREPVSQDRDALVLLDRNERLAPLPNQFVEHLKSLLTSEVFTCYPVQDDLLSRLSQFLELSPSNLLLTAGSDAAIKALYQAYVGEGDRVVMLSPSYAMYPVYAQMFQAEAVKVPFAPDLSLDSDQLLTSICSGVRLVMLANPNQPTGTLLPESLLRQILSRAAEVDALVAIDEAYYPFSQTTVLSWLQDYPHLVMTRTFSKAAGLAGLRIGFVAGHPDIIGNLYKVRSVHDVNSMALLVAEQILDCSDAIEDYVVEVELGKALLARRVQQLGLVPLPTHTNFMLIRVAQRCSPEQLVAVLRDRGYLVKGPFTESCLQDCIRVTLGPPAVMSAFADVLAQALTTLPNL